MNSSIVCPICKSQNSLILSAYRGTHKSFLGLDLVKCKDCEMVFANPMPEESDLIEYNKSYFDSAHGGINQTKSGDAFFKGIARLRGSFLKGYLDLMKSQPKRILEIGPGPGYFAENWLKLNPHCEYFAMETDLSCHASLIEKGVVLVKEDEYEQFIGTIDAVVISHVLEHVSDPRGFVAFATEFLRSKGVLYIDVPCRDWEHKSLDEPHLLFFDKKPMNYLLTTLGFDSIQVGYFGETIFELKNRTWFKRKLRGLRLRLINLGCVFFFGIQTKGMESIFDPYERAILKPFKAHKESNDPAWWLRSTARKK